MQKLISIELNSDFGFFRKPDANNTINLSYNMIHKPAILGILGAIIGLGGYTQAYEKELETPLKKGEKRKPLFPEFYHVLKEIPIGIEPLNHEQGNFQKTVIKYSNTVGYANNGSTYLTEEATLIKPSYRIFLLLDLENEQQNKLYNHLKDGKTEYIPYFGKNEFQVWWDKKYFMEYDYELKEPSDSYRIQTLFEKRDIVNNHTENIFDIFSFHEKDTPYMYFERIPKFFNEELIQYELGEFVFTTFHLNINYKLNNLYYLKDRKTFVQLQ